jgi:hypothetical protein
MSDFPYFSGRKWKCGFFLFQEMDTATSIAGSRLLDSFCVLLLLAFMSRALLTFYFSLLVRSLFCFFFSGEKIEAKEKVKKYNSEKFDLRVPSKAQSATIINPQS